MFGDTEDLKEYILYRTRRFSFDKFVGSIKLYHIGSAKDLEGDVLCARHLIPAVKDPRRPCPS